jgi:hypothetical protein
LLRAYEELVCSERRTGVSLDGEALSALQRRWGFDTPVEWATAWAEASLDADFDARARDRVDRLCPLPVAPTVAP